MAASFFNTVFKLPLLILASGTLLIANPALAQSEDSGVEACLKAWGTHPFGANPKFSVLATSVRVFGIGRNTVDATPTSTPALVVVNAGVNVMGGSSTELLNPNGWYCMRSTVNVMGAMNIRLHCSAKLAMANEGTTVMGDSQENKGVTVMGSTTVERVGCDAPAAPK
jgi:hypothetical protein